ncbi:MAG: nicotinate-nucleotide--dimethylbenzimidazole phosphoribosyltransferase [Vicinamibacterales bacterium]
MMSSALPRLQSAIERVRPVGPTWRDRAEGRLDRLTKPPHSLGRLESIAARLCAIQETLTPRAAPRRIVVFAGDHGVTAEGVSAYPSAVTAQMVGNFLRGGAAINALARASGADVCVVDVGVAGEIDAAGHAASFVSSRVRPGTRNMVHEPAMSAHELASAVGVGLEIADAAARDGVAVLVCGEMGIGNSTAASAMTAAFTRAAASEVTGPGTGIDQDAFDRKTAAIARALRIHQPGRSPLDVLRTVGGLEIAAITGAYVGAAAHRLAIVGDGFIATAAALAAVELCPSFLDYWFAGHLSSEPGHRLQLRYLRQEPLLQLDMRLGEGTGAALAMHLLTAATAVINDMATFDSAGVAGRQELSAPEAAPS